MEIMIPGRGSTHWKREIRCGHCDALLLVFKSDLALRFNEQPDIQRDQVVATCAACRQTVVVEDPAGSAWGWGRLPRRAFCSYCQSDCDVPAVEMRDPRCFRCTLAVSIRTPESFKNEGSVLSSTDHDQPAPP